jgi:hypothetical protein
MPTRSGGKAASYRMEEAMLFHTSRRSATLAVIALAWASSPAAAQTAGVVFTTHDEVRKWWLPNYENEKLLTA